MIVARPLGTAFCAVAILSVTACGSTSPEVAFGTPDQRTCLVLSVGAFKGVAHLGAIEELREQGVQIDCVTGNSMGSLVGALYASAPTQDTTDRFRDFMEAYEEASEREGLGRAVFFGGLVLLLTGGAALPALGGARAGGASTPRLSHRRFVQVFADYVNGSQVEGLPLQYATFHIEAGREGVRTQDVIDGDLADAVGASVANPLMFPDLDPRRGGPIDPGIDRLGSTPVEDTCRLFPDARLIAVNVSGQPVSYSREMQCPLLSIDVDVAGYLDEDIATDEEVFQEVVELGRTATRSQLGRAAL